MNASNHDPKPQPSSAENTDDNSQEHPLKAMGEATSDAQKKSTAAAPAAQTASQPQAMKPQSDDLDFVSDTKAAFLENRNPTATLLLLVIVGMCGAFTYWASVSRIEEVTRGQGVVVPTDFLQVVQSLEGGILSTLSVQEGTVVEKGQTLLQIDDTAFTANQRENAAQRDNLLASIARLEAEASGSSQIRFPETIERNRPDLMESETRLFDSRTANLQGSVDHLNKSLELKRQELEITRPLAEKGIVSQVELLRLESLLNETESELSRIQLEYTKEVLSKRNEAKTKLEQIEQSLVALDDKIRRTRVLSPVKGTVNKINFNTIGGVIRPGDPIMEIVPQESELVVEANILPSDIGFIHPGQEAVVKLTAYDFSIYGGLKGKVESISADSFENEKGERFYKIRVRTGERSLQTNEQEFKVIPGMQVEVNILTGEKSVLDYVFKPLLRARMNALTER